MCAPYFTDLHFFRVLCHVILPNQCLFPMKSKRSGEFEPEFMHFITKTSPCPYALHLLTSFKPLHGAFEPRLWTQPPQKKNTHLSEVTQQLTDIFRIWAWCSWAMRSCSLQFVWHAVSAPKKADAPVRLWPPAPKKKTTKRNMRCSVAKDG